MGQIHNIKFSAAPFIKEIGRGKAGARSLSREDAARLYTAMLERQVSDLEMGGILLAMRIKGESVNEIAGFLDACKQAVLPLQAPSASLFAPVLIPSYNGARKNANLVPLLALLLAREGVPVLVHGVMHDAGRVTSAEIFQALQIDFANSLKQASQLMEQRLPVFMPIEVLSPQMAGILAMRRILGVRNSTHTLVKLLQPFEQPALRLTSFTHPEYQSMLHDYFTTLDESSGAVLLMRATEGEAVASTGRARQISCYLDQQCEIVLQAQTQLVGEPESIPESKDAITTARWIQDVLGGKLAVPNNVAEQVRLCMAVAQKIKKA
ncbi:MAG: DNA-binding protein YbiB [Undibacterium sp.]|nr:DNA-binding protein YbiB [Undibacterium sp.]